MRLRQKQSKDVRKKMYVHGVVQVRQLYCLSSAYTHVLSRGGQHESSSAVRACQRHKSAHVFTPDDSLCMRDKASEAASAHECLCGTTRYMSFTKHVELDSLNMLSRQFNNI